jgi:hypothetical protein
VSPMAWLADARIDRAREILETTTEPVENIGRLTGLGAPVSVRAAFHRRIGISPKEYRAVWRGSSATATATVRHSPPDHEAAVRPSVSRTNPRRGTASRPRPFVGLDAGAGLAGEAMTQSRSWGTTFDR